MTRPVRREGRGGVLVLCLGNPDRGDDGIGALVAERLRGLLPAGAELRLRTGDILAAIEDWAGFDALICVDAAAAAERPGRMHRIDLACDALPRDIGLASSHAFGLAEAIGLARTLQLAPRQMIVYAIEGACFDAGAPISPELAARADALADEIAREARRLGAIAAEEPADA